MRPLFAFLLLASAAFAEPLADRVRETSTTTGTGTLNLAGAVSGYHTFMAKFASGDVVPYYIYNRDVPTEFEYGLGTITDATPDTLSRTTIIGGSNGTSAVNFSAGTKDVFNTAHARMITSRVRTVTGATTLNDLDLVVQVNNTAAITITLPTAVGREGKVYEIHKNSANGHGVTVDGDGSETIEGLTTWPMYTWHDFVRIISDGTNWKVQTPHVVQARTTTTGTTQTVLHTQTLAADTTYLFRYTVMAVRTGGAAGVDGDYAHWVGYANWHRVSTGSATLDNFTDIYSNSSTFLSITWGALGNDIRLQVTGEVDVNYTWTSRVELIQANRFTD